jgi:hypothetical protein
LSPLRNPHLVIARRATARRGNPAEARAALTAPLSGLPRPVGLAMTKREKLPAKTFFPIAETLSPSPNG